MSRGDSVKIRPHPGASKDNLIDHIKPAIRKNPDIVVIHTGTNDLQQLQHGEKGKETGRCSKRS